MYMICNLGVKWKAGNGVEMQGSEVVTGQQRWRQQLTARLGGEVEAIVFTV